MSPSWRRHLGAYHTSSAVVASGWDSRGQGRHHDHDDRRRYRHHPARVRPGRARKHFGTEAGGFHSRAMAPKPGWPDDPETVADAKAHPEVFAGKTVGQVADHFAGVIRGLNQKPAIIGHSFGGLLTQILAGRGLAAVSVAIDPAPFRGVLPLPISALKASSPVLSNPANRSKAIPLTYDQFRFAFANAVSEDEAKQLYEEFAVPASGAPLFQAATANLNPWTEAKVNTINPDRGPLLIIDGDKDNTVPWAIANASYKRQKRNPGVTEITKIAGRGHALTIDSGWKEVAETALAFVQRFA
ncbi:MAG: alpha/beta hydrolase [Chloroflexi bacterium]|nr:MAG: alpha/beta hydrolase [Chloroflexota bacterium]